MQILITQAGGLRSRSFSLNGLQLGLGFSGLVLLSLLLCTFLSQFLLQKAVLEHWPVVSQLVQSQTRATDASRDKYLRENLDAMAEKVGQLEAKLVKLEAMSDRVSSLAGVKPEEFREPALKGASAPGGAALQGSGGPYVPMTEGTDLKVASLTELSRLIDVLDEQVDQRTDAFTYVESRLFEKRMTALMIPSSAPINVPVGSGFGYRTDPFTGRTALHTGLDFPSPVGTPIHAAAGGVVVAAQMHPQYGNMVEIDHGNGLETRYGHASKILVHPGDLVKRGQVIALVGTTGRSTGPHLHFEVLVQGVQQDPAKFLGNQLPANSQMANQAFDATR